MGLKDLFQKATLSRRSVLKGMGAAVATAAVAGCSSESDDFNPMNYGQQGLTFETADRTAFNTGPFNCGSKCVHKFHVKNGRIVAMTSAGDIPRDRSSEDEYGSTVEGQPMQFRSCVRGYSYIQRVYQPDRLKYPLMQTGNKGDISSFKRVTWEEALTAIGNAMKAAFDREAELGYIPAVDRMSFVSSVAPTLGKVYLKHCSNASNGNYEAAKLDSVGTSMMRNSKSDNLNAKFIIIWGADPTRHSNHENGSYWMYTQAKERNVDVVTISPVCTDQAAIYSKTIRVNVPATDIPGAASGTVTIPGWIPIRPGTDGALALAMCYVLYRRELYDKTYLTTGAGRKCFGFYKDDSVTSIGPAKTRSGFRFVDPSSDDMLAQMDSPFNGQLFTVPENESFEEILMNLEKSVANGGWAKTQNGAMADNTTEGGLYVPASNDAYAEVLEYASKLTGVSSEIIEALAIHFRQTDPSKIDGGCGPQRQYAGAEWAWVMISFTVMCGHVEKKGGGLPIGMGSFADNNVFSSSGAEAAGTGFIFNSSFNGEAYSQNYIDFMDQNLADVVLSGLDGRSVAQLQSDIKRTVSPEVLASNTKVANLQRMEVDFYSQSSNNRLITQPNVNKTIEAYKNIKTVVVCDQVMTPSAAYADIVLPAATHLEDVGGSIGGQGEIKILKENVLRETMYDTKRQGEINTLYYNACAKALGIEEKAAYQQPTEAELANIDGLRSQVDKFVSAPFYDRAVGHKAVIYSDDLNARWEQFKNNGCLQIVTPSDTPVISLVHHLIPGVPSNTTDPKATADINTTRTIETSTGYINFWSPFWSKRMSTYQDKTARDTAYQSRYTTGKFPAGWRTPVADYIPVNEGYEKFFEGNNVHNAFTGYKGARPNTTYKLQFMTNKARNRAHTCQDNVAIIKDQFEQKVYINPVDAAERGIQNGDLVYVYNDRGCTKIRAEVTHYIVPGVISVEHGSWYRASKDPNETFTAYLKQGFDGVAQAYPNTPIDVGGCENLLTDDTFVYDVIYVNQTAGLHGGPVEVSLTKPE